MIKLAAGFVQALLTQGVLFAVLLAGPAWALDVEAIAVTGDSAPGGGEFTSFASFPSIRDDGTVAFVAGATGGESAGGVFLWSRESGIRALRREGEIAPNGARYVSLRLASARALNAAGDVAGLASLDDGSTGIFVFSASGDRQIALLGDLAPGTSCPFVNRFLNVGLSDTGAVAWQADLLDCSTSRLFPGRGVYANFGAGNVAIANQGDTVFGSTVEGFPPYGGVAINATSQVAYFAYISEPLDSAIILDAAGSPGVGIRRGDALPGTGGGTFGTLTDEFLGLSDSGNIAFSADIGGEGSIHRGVFAITSSGIRKVAVHGEPIPTGGVFDFDPNDFMSAQINDTGDVVFTPRLNGGLYYDIAGLGLIPAAREGWPAPGTGGGTFSFSHVNFQHASLSESGAVFFSFIDGGTGGSGIFLVPRDSVPAMTPFAWSALMAALLAAATSLLRTRERQAP